MNRRIFSNFVFPITVVFCAAFAFISSSDVKQNSTHDRILLGTWIQGINVITPRLAGIGVSYQRNDTGWIFMCGGDLDYAGTVTGTNQRYNVNTNTWDSRAPHPSPREYFGGARLGNYMYSIAGMTAAYFTSEDKHCYRYDIINNSWTQISDITPEPTQGIGGNRAVGYHDSLIYCAGGFNGGSSVTIASVYLYNANTNTWRAATSLPAPRALGAFTVKGDTLVYVGGSQSLFYTTFIGLISQTDRSQISWTYGAPYPGTSSVRFNAEPWGPKGIIVAGGSTGIGSSTECYVYSPGRNVWTQQPNVPHTIGSTQSGTVFFSSGLMKLVCASGEQYPTTPYAVPYTQIYTDTGSYVGIQPKSNNIPQEFSLSQNYPNPFNPVTKITFSIPPEPVPTKSGKGGGGLSVRLVVYDILGKEVASLIPPLRGGQEGLRPGMYEVEWDGSNYPSGVYFYKLITDFFSETKKMVLIK